MDFTNVHVFFKKIHEVKKLDSCEHGVVSQFWSYEWLDSDFIPENGKIFEFQKNFMAILFGLKMSPTPPLYHFPE